MNRTIRRAGTVAAATAGVFALGTGTAMAHYCYRTDVPEKSKMANGQPWMTQEETLAEWSTLPFLQGECRTLVLAHIASLPEDTLFMGPGLLAGGAVAKGQGPEGVGHLIDYIFELEECAYLFQEG